MTIDDLKKFCSTGREFLEEPFSQGEFTYATDGKIAIRVNKIDGIEDVISAPNMKKLNWDHGKHKDWVSLPDYSQDGAQVCSECKGNKHFKDCPECCGHGDVYVNNDFNEYLCCCKTCNGNGSIPSSEGDACEACCGTGFVAIPVEFGPGHISSSLLNKIKILPGVLLSQSGDGHEPFKFVFDDGCGLIMPTKF